MTTFVVGLLEPAQAAVSHKREKLQKIKLRYGKTSCIVSFLANV